MCLIFFKNIKIKTFRLQSLGFQYFRAQVYVFLMSQMTQSWDLKWIGKDQLILRKIIFLCKYLIDTRVIFQHKTCFLCENI